MDEVDLFIPESHAGKSLDNFDWEKLPKVKQMVEQALKEDEEKGLFLFGDPGIGKTHLLIGMFREFYKKGYVVGQDVQFVQWSNLMTEVSEVLAAVKSPEKIMDNLTQVRVLIIDDVRPGWGRIWADCVKRIIEMIYEKKGKLILSANLVDVNDMVVKWQLEDYWLSRLKSCIKFVKMKGEDRRGTDKGY